MPLYEYECDACGQRFERIQKFSDPIADTCSLCGKGPVRRLMSSPAIQFKGAGWYITDYAKKGSKGGDEGSSSSSEKSTKSDSTDTKSTSTETKSTTSSDSTPAPAPAASKTTKDS